MIQVIFSIIFHIKRNFFFFFLFFEYILKYSQVKKHLFLEIKNQFLSKYDNTDKTKQINKNKLSKHRCQCQ